MPISCLVAALLGGILLLGGPLSVMADWDRARDTRHRLMQRDDRSHYAPHIRGWQYPRMQREYRYPQPYRHEHRHRSMPGLGQYQIEPPPRPANVWPYQQDRLGNERGRSFDSERFYPDSPAFDERRVYPPPRPVLPGRDEFPHRTPHPPGIHRPQHDDGL